MSGGADDADPNPVVKLLQTVTPTPIRRSFAIKFGLALLVMAVSIGSIGMVATDRIAAETQQNVETEYRTIAEQEADVINKWIQRNRQTTAILSTKEQWDRSDARSLELALERERSSFDGEAFHLHIVDYDGEKPIVKASTTLENGTSLGDTDRAWLVGKSAGIKSTTENEVFIEETYSAGSESVIGFVSPINAANDRYLLVEFSTASIQKSLQGQDRAEGGFTQIVDTDSNTVLLDETSEDTLSVYADDKTTREPIRRSKALQDDQNRSAGVITSMDANDQVIDEEYTVAYAPIQGTSWTVVTHAPRSSVFGFVQTISNWGLFATIAAVLLIGITGTVLGYSTSTAIDHLTRKTEQMREGTLDVSVSTSRIDNIGRLYDGFAEMRDALKEQIEEAERAQKEAEVSRAEALEMTNYLQERAEENSKVMQQCAAGDLTQRMSQDGENESMDRIASEFNNMIEELEKTTGQLKSYVDEVEEAGAEVEQSAITVRKASEQVADSIQKIAADAEDQKERLQHSSEMIDEAASELEEFADRHPDVNIDDQLSLVETIAGELNEIAQLSETTQSETDTVSAAAEEQAAELNEVGERANDLQRYAQPLRDILNGFETESEHEFVFSVGPTDAPAQRREDGEE
ncbi:MAG: methyl-accepting chemotaxis protein [Haloarculaceae archaeon]